MQTKMSDTWLVSKSLFERMKEQAAPAESYTFFGYGFKIQQSSLLPIKIEYPACDIATRREVTVKCTIEAISIRDPYLFGKIPPTQFDALEPLFDYFPFYVTKKPVRDSSTQ